MRVSAGTMHMARMRVMCVQSVAVCCVHVRVRESVRVCLSGSSLIGTMSFGHDCFDVFYGAGNSGHVLTAGRRNDHLIFTPQQK